VRLQLRSCQVPASKGRRQANNPHFQLGNKRLLCAGRSRNGRLSPSRHLIVICGGSQTTGYGAWSSSVIGYRTAIFRQVNKDKAYTHHDALEFPDGKIVLADNSKAGPAGNRSPTPSRTSEGPRETSC
jgi:hypothetical protein